MVAERFTWIDGNAGTGAAPELAGRGTVVVVGNFDGVHLGHRAVLTGAVAEASARGLAPVVLTFSPHPGAVLGRGEPPRLTSLAYRAELIARLGVAHVFVRRFDRAFAAWTPDDFARRLLQGALGARIVVVGRDFRFGAARAGDLAALQRLGAALGFEARGHGIEGDAGGAYSSTRVRRAVEAGDLAEAARVLGRPHAFAGRVVRGAQRGRTIGFPTANLDAIDELVPPNGVYAVLVDVAADGEDGGSGGGGGASGTPRALGPGVMNVGVRPTVDGGAARVHVEVHVLGAAGATVGAAGAAGEPLDLYGQLLRVHLVTRLRDERRFAGLDELRAQIARDADAARAALAPFAPHSARGTYG